MSRRPIFNLIITLFSLHASPGLAALNPAEKPSWFPDKTCIQSWGLHAKKIQDWDPQKDPSYSAYYERQKRAKCFKPWTILVYMAAENDLTPYAYWDLYEMEAGWTDADRADMDRQWDRFGTEDIGDQPFLPGLSPRETANRGAQPTSGNRALSGSTLRSDVIVQLETKENPAPRRLHIFERPETYNLSLRKPDFDQWTSERVYSPTVSQVQVPDDANPFTAHNKKLLEFLEWGIKTYPAEHYMVVLWGHGQGWSPGAGVGQGDAAFSARRFGGIAFDETDGSYIGISTLRGILKSVQNRIFEGKRKIDLYASDACLMQMLEVSYEISNSTRFVVGSAQVQDFLGLPYRNLLYLLNTGRYRGTQDWNKIRPSAAPKNFWKRQKFDEPYMMAQIIPKVVRRSFDPDHGIQGAISPRAIETMTMSAISSEALNQRFLPRFSDFSNQLRAYFEEDYSRSDAFAAQVKRVPTFMGGAQDAGVFFSLMKIMLDDEARRGGSTALSRSLRETLINAEAALQSTVVSSAFGKLYDVNPEHLFLKGFQAVSVWLPKNETEYNQRFQAFRLSEFFRYRRVPPGTGLGPWEGLLDSLYGPR